jgi:hypothetical protein
MPEGEYRPINRLSTMAKQERFDFQYEGDIIGTLAALKVVAPQINVMPPVGKPVPVQVKVQLHATTLESALRAIGEQGGEAVDVVLNSTRHQGGNQVFIRFRTPSDGVQEMNERGNK